MKLNDPNLSDEHSPLGEQGDADALMPGEGPKYGKQRWTLGNSGGLVEGAQKESPWVGIAWIVVPTVLALLILAGLFAP